MKVFISGASGLVGGNCLNYFQSQPQCTVIGSYFSFETEHTVYFNTLEPSDEKNFDLIAFQPDVILHCGALTHVDYCETNEEESALKTVQSTKNLLEICAQTSARLVYISTDYVFDGSAGPYTEDATTNPLSVYGKHKLEAEELVIAAQPRDHLIIRITNVYGDEMRGKNFIARMINNVRQEEEIRFSLPVDQYATPANAWDIARVLYTLLTDGKSGIYHVASTDWVNRVQLAELVMKHAPGHHVTIDPVFTKSMNQAAERPLLGGLIAKKFLDEYPEFSFSNVDDYVREQLRKES